MGARRQGREAAVRLLYQVELTGDLSDETLTRFWNDLPQKLCCARSFTDDLVRSVLGRVAEIDGMIDSAANNWHLDRIARIDLSILRLAVAELTDFPDVPAEVIIDEAVDLARKYSDVEAPGFVNGVLDRVARDQQRFSRGPNE